MMQVSEFTECVKSKVGESCERCFFVDMKQHDGLTNDFVVIFKATPKKNRSSFTMSVSKQLELTSVSAEWIAENAVAGLVGLERSELQSKIDSIPFWYHKINLGNGVVTPGWAPLNPDAYRIPERMDGENVLDVGAWDGYWTFEALKRGAKHVTAIDDFSDTCGDVHNADRSKAWHTFDLCAEALGYSICRMPFSMESELSRVDVSVEIEWCDGDPFESSFNRLFCFGVLYHLRNPLKALENCFKWMIGGGTIHIETAILDNISSVYTGQPHDANGCYAEFYPTNQFGMNASNWWVPTLKCAAAWLQAAGFVDIEQWKLTDMPKSLAECRGFLKARKP